MASDLLCYTCCEMVASIHALIFDLDDTLVVEEASAEAAFIESGELARDRYGLDPRELHTTLRRICRELWYAFPSHPYCKRIGISSWEGLWAEFTGPDPELKALRNWAPTYRCKSWQLALRGHGIDDPGLAAELAETFPRLRRGKHVVYEDVPRVLEQLRGNYSLGLLTNGASDLQRRKIEGSGIAGYFDRVLISGDVGIAKPDRRFFEMMLSRMEARPETTLMIGNSLRTDIQGAQGARMLTVWINRSGSARDDAVVPDWEISSLDALSPILSRRGV
jgi:putative hydrolase of the HAD superfamily